MNGLSIGKALFAALGYLLVIASFNLTSLGTTVHTSGAGISECGSVGIIRAVDDGPRQVCGCSDQPGAKSSNPCVPGALISEQATSLTMPAGSDLYIFGFATGGCCPTGDFQSGQYASVNDVDGFRIAGLAVTTDNTNSYPSMTAYNTIGGVAVSGFSSYTSSYQAITAAGPDLSVSDTFSVSKPHTLVVVFAIGGGVQCQQLSGVPDLTVNANTLNLNPIITIAHSYLKPGTYAATVSTQQCAAGQDPNHAGDLIGVFIFTPGHTRTELMTAGRFQEPLF